MQFQFSTILLDIPWYFGIPVRDFHRLSPRAKLGQKGRTTGSRVQGLGSGNVKIFHLVLCPSPGEKREFRVQPSGCNESSRGTPPLGVGRKLENDAERPGRCSAMPDGERVGFSPHFTKGGGQRPGDPRPNCVACSGSFQSLKSPPHGWEPTRLFSLHRDS
jgi:hypothetical protein